MNDFVVEMRRRSPAAVQKWVDSIPINNTTSSTLSNENIESSEKADGCEDVKDEKTDITVKNKLLDSTDTTDVNKRKFGILGELYNKLDLNKHRNVMKPIKKQYSFEEQQSQDMEEDLTSQSQLEIKDSTADEIFQFDETLALPASTSTPDKSPNTMEANIEANALKNRKKMRINEIGRSFSENRSTDLKTDFVINERNNSCPNSIPTLDSKGEHFNFTTTASTIGSQKYNNEKNNAVTARSFSFSDRHKNPLFRDNSMQSDSSHCSSVESLLDSRKPDPETILINLGFGPIETDDVLSKIPKRFLKPSQVRGINTEEFIRQQKLASQIHENSVLGYRGLVGNPHTQPSMIVARIHERFQENEKNRSTERPTYTRPISAPSIPGSSRT